MFLAHYFMWYLFGQSEVQYKPLTEIQKIQAPVRASFGLISGGRSASDGQGRRKISVCTWPPLENGLDVSICTYKCRSLLRDELIDDLLQEVGTHATSLACAKHVEMWISTRLRGMETRFSWVQGICRGVWTESTPEIGYLTNYFLSVSRFANRCASPLTRSQQNP